MVDVLSLLVAADRLRGWLMEDAVTFLAYSLLLSAVAFALGRSVEGHREGTRAHALMVARKRALLLPAHERAMLYAVRNLPGPFLVTEHVETLEALEAEGLVRRTRKLAVARDGGATYPTWSVPADTRAALAHRPLTALRLWWSWRSTGMARIADPADVGIEA